MAAFGDANHYEYRNVMFAWQSLTQSNPGGPDGG
jgi:hypothetical protein